MENNHNSIPIDDCSDLITRAFVPNKMSPYARVSSHYCCPKTQSMFDDPIGLNDESISLANSARSAFSSMDSVATTHIENGFSCIWAEQEGVTTPQHLALSSQTEDPDVRLLKVIKTLFTQGIVDVFRKYIDEIVKKDVKTMIVQKDTGKIHLDINSIRARVFAVLRKCLIHNTEVNVVHIFEAIREKYTTTLTDDIPSFGSITHSNGYCKPCVFANKAINSCKNGVNCNFCHFKHRITRRKSAAREAQEFPKVGREPCTRRQSWACITPQKLQVYLPHALSTNKPIRQITPAIDNRNIFNFTGR
ncbi:hypothetical protein, conserved [Babesia bigemina]|uniref:C3H1-type domain-containing protein n=1 Tax=Babesia bigemina TaxID=5866 RepID=A0A061DAY1_BABBI|nr:hypothetical protein, conserved [Babesia bigemina]CDR94875.1 hypothetical protein, conserved [Babesia bigemina]|eukprot:XP_012767061.1 hypothetical protein, conserved [Babesia bigemina]